MALKSELIDCGNGVRLERGLRCELTDGTRLASDHYYPAGEGPWPTLLMRQPYGRDIASTVVYAHPIVYARHGYHVAIQDVRGRGDSDGLFYPFRHEARDGAETIAWLRKHPASNGRIGMYGFSYQGMTQLLAAAEQPEGLQCIAPHMTAADLYNGWFYHHGALRLSSSLGWGIQMLREDVRRLGLRDASDKLEAAWANIRTQALHHPYGDHPAIADAELPRYVRDWFTHRDPGEYWTGMDISERLDNIRVPALHIAGWFDTYLEGSIAGYLALRRRAGSELARDNQYLIAGPWAHIPWGDRVGDANLGEAANLNTDAVLLEWFDHWLKDSGDFNDDPRIRYFSLGPNEWRTAKEWSAAADCPLYLHSDGNANSRKGDGTLTLAPPCQDEPRDAFVYDPEVPVMAPGGPQALSGPSDQSVIEMGNNLLVYTSEPAVRDMEIFGHPSIQLHAITSAPCADFTAKIVRVTVAGRAEFLSIGIARSGRLFRESGYAADETYLWDFTLEPVAFVLAPGERLRLEIASSAFPLYDRNPSTEASPQNASVWNWGALNPAGFAFGYTSICALFAMHGSSSMVTEIKATIPEIALHGVCKRYRNAAVALENISLTVERGEFVTLLGPSGCGKSTLLKLVSGLSPVSEGTIQVNGMTPENARELVSFIFQDATLLPWRTVEQNVGLGLELEYAARPARKERVEQMLDLVSLGHVAKRFPRQLSGGMKMRVSIARALASRPRILLMDEPFAALDEMTRDRLNEELLRLYVEKKWTVLFVTHSVTEAVFLSSRIVILAAHPGRVAHEIKVNLPWPRTAQTRESKAFEEQVTLASRLLRGVYQV